jgi:hypothetical protein
MSASVAAFRRRALSTAAVMALGTGLGLYQMTSLVLGPVESRQLHISLSVPAVDLDALSDPALWNLDFAVGTLLAASPAAAQSQLNALERSSSSTMTASPWSPSRRRSSLERGNTIVTNYHVADERGLRLARRR